MCCLLLSCSGSFSLNFTANDVHTFIVFLASSWFSKRLGIDDNVENVFSSILKGVASKLFLGALPPDPCLFHFSMNTIISDYYQGLSASTFPKFMSGKHTLFQLNYQNFQYDMTFYSGNLEMNFIVTGVTKRSNEKPVIVGILSFCDPLK